MRGLRFTVHVSILPILVHWILSYGHLVIRTSDVRRRDLDEEKSRVSERIVHIIGCRNRDGLEVEMAMATLEIRIRSISLKLLKAICTWPNMPTELLVDRLTMHLNADSRGGVVMRPETLVTPPLRSTLPLCRKSLSCVVRSAAEV